MEETGGGKDTRLSARVRRVDGSPQLEFWGPDEPWVYYFLVGLSASDAVVEVNRENGACRVVFTPETDDGYVARLAQSIGSRN